MVKGISRQVIVVQSPDPKLFEQAIFILKEGAMESGGVTDQQLLSEANRLIRSGRGEKLGIRRIYGPIWACAGALLTGIAWVICTLI